MGEKDVQCGRWRVECGVIFSRTLSSFIIYMIGIQQFFGNEFWGRRFYGKWQ